MCTQIPATPNGCARNHTLYAGIGQMLAWMRPPRTQEVQEAAMEEPTEIPELAAAWDLVERVAKLALPVLALFVQHILSATQATSKWP
jgi:hypothetical protein